MTFEDVKRIRLKPTFVDVDNEELAKMLDIAVERRIPKKPRFYDSKFRQRGEKYGRYVTIEDAYNCPYCNCTVWGTDKNNFCDNCGQALDWSDTE